MLRMLARTPLVPMGTWTQPSNVTVWILGSILLQQNQKKQVWKLISRAKKDVIESLKGWVVQDDFDRTVSRPPPNIRYNILRVFASMIIIKDCMRLFWSNPFWYLNADCEFLNSEGPFRHSPTYYAQEVSQRWPTPWICDLFMKLQS